MPSTHFDLVSQWRLHAPPERVWAALVDTASWPHWWPFVREVRALRDGNADGVGSVRRIDWATRLPYRIAIDVEAIESVRLQRLRVRSQGQLEGEGLWLLRADAGCTDVTCVWRVRLAARWMRWLALPLAPVFRWNHAAVMRAGEIGLQRHLVQALAGADPATAAAAVARRQGCNAPRSAYTGCASPSRAGVRRSHRRVSTTQE